MRIYEGDQWTQLFVSQLGKSVVGYHVDGTSSRDERDFEIFVEAHVHESPQALTLILIRLDGRFSDGRRPADIWERRIYAHFREAIEYYIMQDNFSMWNETRDGFKEKARLPRRLTIKKARSCRGYTSSEMDGIHARCMKYRSDWWDQFLGTPLSAAHQVDNDTRTNKAAAEDNEAWST